jgi:hypothetical protein
VLVAVANNTIRRLGMLLLTALVSGGCSIANPFVVINQSSAPVQVRYEASRYQDPHSGRNEPRRLDAPAIKTARDARSWNGNWQGLDPAAVGIDPVEQRYEVTLQPGYALRVASITNYFGHDKENLQFGIGRVEIVGNSGKLVLEGDQARKQFVDNDGVYELVYR